MKISSVGIVLLTLMVVTKYYISIDTMPTKDALLSRGFFLDYNDLQEQITGLVNPTQTNELIAFNAQELNQSTLPSVKHHSTTNTVLATDAQETAAYAFTAPEETNVDEPAPMEYGNTLVVFNPSNPAIVGMTTQYEDPYDNSAPLDNGNTVINEMQMMMPRR